MATDRRGRQPRVALTLLWRRTHPLAAVALAFGTLIVFDVARTVASDATGLASVAAALVLPYALFRWDVPMILDASKAELNLDGSPGRPGVPQQQQQTDSYQDGWDEVDADIADPGRSVPRPSP